MVVECLHNSNRKPLTFQFKPIRREERSRSLVNQVCAICNPQPLGSEELPIYDHPPIQSCIVVHFHVEVNV